MDLMTFRQHLREMDRLNDSVKEQMFDCNAQKLDVFTYSYNFDATICCVLRFYPTGIIEEWIDVSTEDWANTDVQPTRTHLSVYAWIETTTTELRSPL